MKVVMLICPYVFLNAYFQRTQMCRQQALLFQKEIVSMSMHSGVAPMELVEMKFSDGHQFQPWKDKARGIEWMQEEVLNASVDTKDGVIWKILFHTGRPGMTVYLENLSNDAVTENVIPTIRTLVGPTGKVRFLNTEEVSEALSRDNGHKAVMQAKTAAVGGDLGRVQSFLETAMSWQGRVDMASPSETTKENVVTARGRVLDCTTSCKEWCAYQRTADRREVTFLHSGKHDTIKVLSMNTLYDNEFDNCNCMDE